MYRLVFSIKSGKFSIIIPSNISSIPFSLTSLSGTFVMCMLLLLMVSHISLRFCSCFFILFSLCSSNYIFPIDLSLSLLIHSSIVLNLLLRPYSEFFILFIIVFYSRFAIYFFQKKITSRPLLIFLTKCSQVSGFFFFFLSSALPSPHVSQASLFFTSL